MQRKGKARRFEGKKGSVYKLGRRLVPMKGWTLVAVCSLVFAGIWFAVQINANERETHDAIKGKDIVAYVNGEPVELGELVLFVEKSRGIITASGSLEDVKRLAMERLVQAKVMQLEAVRLQIIKDASYSSFLQELRHENERRARALENSEVIYGPRSYSAATYYDYRHSIVGNSLKERWANDRFDLSDEPILSYYERNRDWIAAEHDTLVLHLIAETSKERILAVKQQLQEGDSFQNIYNARIPRDGLAEEEIINHSNYREVSKYRSHFYESVKGMEEGQISDIIQDGQRYVIAMVVSRQLGGYRPFEEVREEVMLRYLDEAFNLTLDRLVAEAEISYTPLYDSFPAD